MVDEHYAVLYNGQSKEDIEEQFDLSTGYGMKDFRISQETTGGVDELYKKV